MNINNFEFSEKLPSINAYFELFETTGWNNNYNFSKEELQKTLKCSWYVLSIYNLDKLIGFGRVIADGVHHALIVDLIIHPDYKNKGLGSDLLHRLVQKCKIYNIRDVQLFSAKDKSGFYHKHGFEDRPINAPGMQYKHSKH